MENFIPCKAIFICFHIIFPIRWYLFIKLFFFIILSNKINMRFWLMGWFFVNFKSIKIPLCKIWFWWITLCIKNTIEFSWNMMGWLNLLKENNINQNWKTNVKRVFFQNHNICILLIYPSKNSSIHLYYYIIFRKKLQ